MDARTPVSTRSDYNERRGLLTRLLAVILALAALFILFFAFVRPWYLSWGATPEETQRRLPGDEIVAYAAGQETRAISIHEPIERVWPWLAQLGQDRGGFYSYDLLENLVGSDMPTTDRLWRDKQSWQLGDKLRMYPPGQRRRHWVRNASHVYPGPGAWLRYARRRHATDGRGRQLVVRAGTD